MTFKLRLIFSVTLVALSVQVNSKYMKPNDAITDLLDELKNVVNKSISDATVALNEEVYVISVTATTVEGDVITAMSKLADDFKAELNTFSQVAYDHAVDPRDCVGSSEEELNQTVTLTFESFVNSVSLLVIGGNELAADSLSNVQKANDEVAEIEKAIDDCGNDPECLDDLSSRIQQDIGSIPDTAADEIDATKKSMGSINSKIVGVAVVAANEAIIEANILIVPVLQCINNKLAEKY